LYDVSNSEKKRKRKTPIPVTCTYNSLPNPSNNNDQLPEGIRRWLACGLLLFALLVADLVATIYAAPTHAAATRKHRQDTGTVIGIDLLGTTLSSDWN
jgi:hypothetical protein